MFEIEPISFELSNGVKVVYIRRSAFVAHLGVMFHSGSRFEREENAGLAHLVEHMIFKGTQSRSSLEIFSELDSVGGEINAYTNKEEVCVHASFRKVHLDVATGLLSDIVRNPIFSDDELKKEKVVILDEINSYLDTPAERIMDDFEELLFKDHPLGYNILGTKDTVNSLNREDLLTFVDQFFTADRAVVAVVGDFELEELKDLLEKDFGNIKRGEGELISQAYDKLESEHFNQHFDRANYQSHILLGGLAPVDKAHDRLAMTLLMNYLGGPAMNARLVINIREKYGYAYNIEASFTPYTEVGFWTIYAGTDPQYVEKTIALIQEDLQQLFKDGMVERDFLEAKEQLKGHVALSLDSNLELMFYAAKSLLFHDRVDNVEHIYNKIDALNLEQIREICSKVFDPSSISILNYGLKQDSV